MNEAEWVSICAQASLEELNILLPASVVWAKDLDNDQISVRKLSK